MASGKGPKFNTGQAIYEQLALRMHAFASHVVPVWETLPRGKRDAWDQLAWDLPNLQESDREVLITIRNICAVTDQDPGSSLLKIEELLYNHLPKRSAGHNA